MKRYNLKAFRERLGLNQQRLADMLGIAKITYVNIERGVSNPSVTLIEKFEEVFKCDDVWKLFKKFQ